MAYDFIHYPRGGLFRLSPLGASNGTEGVESGSYPFAFDLKELINYYWNLKTFKLEIGFEYSVHTTYNNGLPPPLDLIAQSDISFSVQLEYFITNNTLNPLEKSGNFSSLPVSISLTNEVVNFPTTVVHFTGDLEPGTLNVPFESASGGFDGGSGSFMNDSINNPVRESGGLFYPLWQFPFTRQWSQSTISPDPNYGNYRIRIDLVGAGDSRNISPTAIEADPINNFSSIINTSSIVNISSNFIPVTKSSEVISGFVKLTPEEYFNPPEV